MPDPRPQTEGGISRPKPLRNRRTRAGRGTIDAIRAAKANHCRMLNEFCDGPIEAHHLIPRARGGRWTFDNILGLCRLHHQAVTENKDGAREALAEQLWDSEYAFVIEALGEGAMSRLFGVLTDDRPSGRLLDPDLGGAA